MRSICVLSIHIVSLMLISACAPLMGGSSTDSILLPTADLNAQEIEIAANLTAREVLPDVFVITHTFPWAENLLLVKMADDTLVLVDTPWTPQATEELLAWIKGKYGRKEIIAINGHHHIDNMGGNQALIAAGIPVYGSDLTAQLIAEKGEQDLEEMVTYLEANDYAECLDDYSNMELVPPTEIFPLEEGLTLDFDGEIVDISFPGAGHSLDNIVVYFPDKKLLFGGCLVIGWDQVGNTADADMAAWPDSIRNLQSFDADIIVPGHGKRLDDQLLDHTLKLLDDFQINH